MDSPWPPVMGSGTLPTGGATRMRAGPSVPAVFAGASTASLALGTASGDPSDRTITSTSPCFPRELAAAGGVAVLPFLFLPLPRAAGGDVCVFSGPGFFAFVLGGLFPAAGEGVAFRFFPVPEDTFLAAEGGGVAFLGGVAFVAALDAPRVFLAVRGSCTSAVSGSARPLFRVTFFVAGDPAFLAAAAVDAAPFFLPRPGVGVDSSAAVSAGWPLPRRDFRGGGVLVAPRFFPCVAATTGDGPALRPLRWAAGATGEGGVSGATAAVSLLSAAAFLGSKKPSFFSSASRSSVMCVSPPSSNSRHPARCSFTHLTRAILSGNLAGTQQSPKCSL
mmetsp:Transcript_49460/g.96737  ORF Transcript_49460/g.96737 Transcript_49460/m.96737 type:complete len:333 (+) Transcript_49460:827-1825(+)